MQFLHISDVHLGNQQYGCSERFNDFGRAFLRAIDFAEQHQVAFVLICGDLFHKSAIDPPTLLQAVNNLDRLRKAGIPVVAIAGNHDSARYRDRFSWLDFLAERSYLSLLSPVSTEEGLELKHWDGQDGAYIDIGRVRIIGIPYLGASIRTMVTELPEAISALDRSSVDYTVMMAHTGIAGEMPTALGGLTHNEIVPLRSWVDYLALGHLHKPFERDGWIFNPGALETCGMDERRWEGGYYLVTLTPHAKTKHDAKLIISQRRPFHRFVFDVDQFDTPPKLYDGLRTWLESQVSARDSAEEQPVVELRLEGVLGFDRRELDMDYIKSIVDEVFSPLIPRAYDNTRSTEYDVAPMERLTRSELERSVLRELVGRDARFREATDDWADIISEVKSMALAGSTPEAISSTVKLRIKEIDEE